MIHHTAQSGARLTLSERVMTIEANIQEFADFVYNREAERETLPWTETQGTREAPRLEDMEKDIWSDDEIKWRNGGRDVPIKITGRKHLQDIIRQGWPEGVDRISDMVNELRKLAPELTEVVGHHVWQGEPAGELDIHRVYSGEFDAMWWGPVDEPVVTSRVVRLAVPIGGNNTVSFEELFWNAAPAIMLADILQEAGYRVEINMFMVSEQASGQNKTVAVLRLKEAHEYMGPANVATAALPAFYRGLFYFWQWCAPWHMGSGWGVPTWPKELVTPILGSDAIVLNPSTDRASAHKVAMQALTDLGALDQ